MAQNSQTEKRYLTTLYILQKQKSCGMSAIYIFTETQSRYKIAKGYNFWIFWIKKKIKCTIHYQWMWSYKLLSWFYVVFCFSICSINITWLRFLMDFSSITIITGDFYPLGLKCINKIRYDLHVLTLHCRSGADLNQDKTRISQQNLFL